MDGGRWRRLKTQVQVEQTKLIFELWRQDIHEQILYSGRSVCILNKDSKG